MARIDLLRQMSANRREFGLPGSRVRAIDGFLSDRYGIVLPLSPAEIEREVCRLSGTAFMDRYNYLNDRQAALLSKGKPIPENIATRFYDLIAEGPHASLIISQKRVMILDAAVLLVKLIESLDVGGVVLDVGCSLGYHCTLIEEMVGCGVVGIDLSKVTVERARELRPAGSRVEFRHSSLDAEHLNEEFSLVYSIASLRCSTVNAKRLGEVLKDGGIAVVSGKDWASDDGIKCLNSFGMGVGFVDVIGGWVGVDRGYLRDTVVVAVKGARGAVVRGALEAAQSDWDFFRRYSDDSATPWSEKTQGYCRAKWIDWRCAGS